MEIRKQIIFKKNNDGNFRSCNKYIFSYMTHGDNSYMYDFKFTTPLNKYHGYLQFNYTKKELLEKTRKCNFLEKIFIKNSVIIADIKNEYLRLGAETSKHNFLKKIYYHFYIFWNKKDFNIIK